ncbi:MAG: putative Ig domain-containing protein [Myxococcota bacterium]
MGGLRALTVALAATLWLPGTEAHAATAHYLVVEWTPENTLEVVHRQLVSLPAPPQGYTPDVVTERLTSPARDGERLAARVVSPQGHVVFETVVDAPRFLRAEFHDGTPRRAPVLRPTFVVRAPYVGGGTMHLETALGGPAATVNLDLDVIRAPASVQPPPSDPSINRVDLLIMGDGYTQLEQSAFEAKAAELEAAFFNISPYAEYRSFVRVTSLFTPSNEPGADHPPYDAACAAGDPSCCGDGTMEGDPLAGTFVDTAFDATFCYYNIHRLILVNVGKVFTAAAAAPGWDQILLVVNDTTYGGAGGFPSVLSSHAAAVEIGQHEYGHSFTQLADEYEDPYPGFPTCNDVNGPPCEPNVTNVTSRDALKWAPWVADTTPVPTPEDEAFVDAMGLFQGARYRTSGMYRPKQDCAMRALGQSFCSVCQQAYVLRLYQGGWGQPVDGVDPIEPGTETPSPGVVSPAHGDPVTFTVELLHPTRGALSAQWKVDGEPVLDATGETFTYVPPTPRAVDVSVEVVDPTSRVHPDMAGDALKSTRTWMVTYPNAAPVVGTPPPQATEEGLALTVPLTVSDPDGDAVTCSSGTLPEGATVDGCVLSWLPGVDTEGEYDLTIDVTDGGRTTSLLLHVTVLPGNLAPTLTAPASLAGQEGAPITFDIEANDPEGLPLTWTVAGFPDGAILDDATGAFSWTPDYDEAGEHTLHIEISDGEHTASVDVVITVTNVNRAPVLQPIGPLQVAELSTLTLSINASDPDADTLRYAMDPSPPGATLDAATLTWMPDHTAAGVYPVVVTVSDGVEAVSEAVTITVTNTNVPPTVQPVPPQTVAEGETLALALVAADLDGETLSFSSANLPAGATLSVTGDFSWTPRFDQAGSHTVALVVSDGEAATTLDLDISVTNTNRVPVLAVIPAQMTSEGVELVVAVPVSDPDGDVLQVALSGAEGATYDPTPRQIHWTPGFDQAGAHDVEITVSDGAAEIRGAFHVTVANTNRPPTLDVPEVIPATEGVELDVAIAASDPDGDVTTVEALQLPEGAWLIGGRLTWTPHYDDAGQHPAFFRLSDGMTAVEQRITVDVANVNRGPAFVLIPAQHAEAEEQLEFVVNALDADDDVLAYSVEALPAGAAFDSQAHRFSWTPSGRQAGEHTVDFVVADGVTTDRMNVLIRVRAASDPQVIAPPSCGCIESGDGVEPWAALAAMLGASFNARRRRPRSASRR